MDGIRRLISRPRSFAARGWLFQIHLWTGLVVGLYAVVIGVSGSAIVFAPEMEDWQVREWLPATASGPQLPADEILAALATAYPDGTVTVLYPPSPNQAVFRASVQSKAGRREVFVNAATAEIYGERVPGGGLVRWLRDLHYNLLSGPTGMIVNGAGGLLTVLLAATGILIWWPGKRHWRRAMSIDGRRRWKRINYDTHRAVGFWSMPWLLLVAGTGATFAWPQQAHDLIGRVFPFEQNQPTAKVEAGSVRLPLQPMLDRAQAEVPDGWPQLVVLPGAPDRAVRIYLLSGGMREFHHTSTVDMDPYSGDILLVQREEERSAGDALYAWLVPLHFGSFGGTPVKLLWVLLGWTPAILGISGMWMWWNRSGSKWSGRGGRRVARRALHEDRVVREDARV